MIHRHWIFRQGTVLALQGLAGYQLVLEAETPSEFNLRSGLQVEPELVIMDMAAYELDEDAAQQPLTYIHPDAKFLILYFDINIDSVIRLVRNGASGFCYASADPSTIHQAILDIKKSGNHFNEILRPEILVQIRRGEDPRDENWRNLITRIAKDCNDAHRQFKGKTKQEIEEILKQYMDQDKNRWF